jgi:predicted nucleotidyltransferase
MKNIDEIKSIIRQHHSELEGRFKVKNIGVFGSYVRGEQRKRSDVDILVTFKGAVDFIQFIQLENHLSALLGLKVDVVTKDALKPYIGKHILEEVIYV